MGEDSDDEVIATTGSVDEGRREVARFSGLQPGPGDATSDASSGSRVAATQSSDRMNPICGSSTGVIALLKNSGQTGEPSEVGNLKVLIEALNKESGVDGKKIAQQKIDHETSIDSSIVDVNGTAPSSSNVPPQQNQEHDDGTSVESGTSSPPTVVPSPAQDPIHTVLAVGPEETNEELKSSDRLQKHPCIPTQNEMHSLIPDEPSQPRDKTQTQVQVKRIFNRRLQPHGKGRRDPVVHAPSPHNNEHRLLAPPEKQFHSHSAVTVMDSGDISKGHTTCTRAVEKDVRAIPASAVQSSVMPDSSSLRASTTTESHSRAHGRQSGVHNKDHMLGAGQNIPPQRQAPGCCENDSMTESIAGADDKSMSGISEDGNAFDYRLEEERGPVRAVAHIHTATSDGRRSKGKKFSRHPRTLAGSSAVPNHSTDHCLDPEPVGSSQDIGSSFRADNVPFQESRPIRGYKTIRTIRWIGPSSERTRIGEVSDGMAGSCDASYVTHEESMHLQSGVNKSLNQRAIRGALDSELYDQDGVEHSGYSSNDRKRARKHVFSTSNGAEHRGRDCDAVSGRDRQTRPSRRREMRLKERDATKLGHIEVERREKIERFSLVTEHDCSEPETNHTIRRRLARDGVERSVEGAASYILLDTTTDATDGLNGSPNLRFKSAILNQRAVDHSDERKEDVFGYYAELRRSERSEMRRNDVASPPELYEVKEMHSLESDQYACSQVHRDDRKDPKRSRDCGHTDNAVVVSRVQSGINLESSDLAIVRKTKKKKKKRKNLEDIEPSRHEEDSYESSMALHKRRASVKVDRHGAKGYNP